MSWLDSVIVVSLLATVSGITFCEDAWISFTVSHSGVTGPFTVLIDSTMHMCKQAAVTCGYCSHAVLASILCVYLED